jgi:hypothetical protein
MHTEPLAWPFEIHDERHHMARKMIVQLTDDIDGTEIDSSTGETVAFSYKGKNYEIDLSAKHAKALESALAPYISAGRQNKTTGTTITLPRSKSPKEDLAELREWAKNNGYTVAERGRVSAEVRAAFEASKS